MKFLWGFSFSLAFLFVIICSGNANQILDRVNVDNYLTHRNMVEYHIACLLYNGPCDNIGNEMKRLLPVVAASKCSQCTMQQKLKLRKIIQHWQSNYPKAWNDMQREVTSGRYAHH